MSQAPVFFRFLLVCGAVDLRLHVFDHSRVDSACLRRVGVRFGFGNGWLVLQPYIAALHT
jgi:hypothetical protein